MKPIALSPEQRREIERRRKKNLDRRVYQRLTAVLTVAEGKSRDEVAHVLGIGLSQLGEWLRIFRNEGLDALCTSSLPGRRSGQALSAAHQVDQLKEKVSTGCFRNSDQILPVASGHLRYVRLFAHRDEGSAQAGRRQPPQGERLLVESRPGQTARSSSSWIARHLYREAKRPAAPRIAATTSTCVSSRLGPGPGVLLLAAGRQAFAGGYGLRKQAAEHPRRLLPRRPRIHRLPVDSGQHQRRTVRQLPAFVAGRCIPQTGAASSCTWTGHATTAAVSFR